MDVSIHCFFDFSNFLNTRKVLKGRRRASSLGGRVWWRKAGGQSGGEKIIGSTHVMGTWLCCIDDKLVLFFHVYNGLNSNKLGGSIRKLHTHTLFYTMFTQKLNGNLSYYVIFLYVISMLLLSNFRLKKSFCFSLHGIRVNVPVCHEINLNWCCDEI